MARVLIVYHSLYGHVAELAKHIAEGVDKAGGKATVKRVPETLPDEILKKMHAFESVKSFTDEIVTVTELPEYDAIIFGTPTRFGAASAQMRSFLDSTGQLWQTGALIGKVGSVFTSSATQHGGQESTILSFHTTLLHHGMIIVGLPYSFKGQMTLDEITGISPYGLSTIAGGDGSRRPSKNELDGARFLGEHVANITSALVHGRSSLHKSDDHGLVHQPEKKDEVHHPEKKEDHPHPHPHPEHDAEKDKDEGGKKTKRDTSHKKEKSKRDPPKEKSDPKSAKKKDAKKSKTKK